MEGKELPFKVQSEWENVSGPLSPMDRLNAAFETIPVSDFPLLALGSVIEVKSDASFEEALQILTEYRIYSAPVLDVQAAAESSWMEKYLGMIDFAGIVHWLLKQSELAGLESGDIAALGGDMFVEMKASEAYKNAKVSDIAGSFRWAPFISVQPTDSLLTVLLLLSKYRMKSLPMVESGKGNIFNFITQGDVTHMLVQCSGLSWFDKLGKSSLSQLGLPKARDAKLLQVDEGVHVTAAFELMNRNGVGGIPVLANGTRKVVGNISASDVSFLLTAPEIFHHDRPLTAGKFLASLREHLKGKNENSPPLRTPKPSTLRYIVKGMIADVFIFTLPPISGNSGLWIPVGKTSRLVSTVRTCVRGWSRAVLRFALSSICTFAAVNFSLYSLQLSIYRPCRRTC